jgi:subtilisin family serine protease
MDKRNFLLGKGEVLTEPIVLPSSFGDKKHPYTFMEARTRLTKMLQNVVTDLDALPEAACPDDYAVAAITLHPSYIAKSYFPTELLREAGLETVGSRPRLIKPEKHTQKKEVTEMLTTELFVKGTRKQFSVWNQQFVNLNESSKVNQQIIEIESISFPDAQTKVKNIPAKGKHIAYEIVLHLNKTQAENGYLDKFQAYLSTLGINTSLPHRFYANGLCFLGLEAPAELAEKIATFSLIRVIRAMPNLRMLKPNMRAAYNKSNTKVVLPQASPLDKGIRVAIFDGGISDKHPLTAWVTPYDFPGMRPPTQEMLNHGASVTSAFLFGHIDPSKPLPVPYALVDHYRVVDDAPGQHPFELFEVLERIKSVLQSDKKKYDFINLSLGPELPVNDDEVHSWTAMLDQHLSTGQTLATIAVGNYRPGESERIQVPGDCVNALTIGACDLPGDGWKRAPYSAKGPGRSPGLVKPDLLEFGGYGKVGFSTLSADGSKTIIQTQGTSYASPSVLRLATGLRAHFAETLNLLAIRALLIHSCENANMPAIEVGWGRVARMLDDIVLCKDGTVRVVYQGEIPPAKNIRVTIPFPSGTLKGTITIKATLCYATMVDPDHPGNYTRSGLIPIFRPNKKKFAENATQPKSQPFFTKTLKGKRHKTEEELRTDAWKWENCIHASVNFRHTSSST